MSFFFVVFCGSRRKFVAMAAVNLQRSTFNLQPFPQRV